MWSIFLRNFNGKSLFLHDDRLRSSDIHLYTDASNLACGGIFGSRWFMILFDSEWVSYSIAVRELYPIAISLYLWGNTLRDRRLVFHCDNASIVEVINRQTSKDDKIMILLGQLILTALYFTNNK